MNVNAVRLQILSLLIVFCVAACEADPAEGGPAPATPSGPGSDNAAPGTGPGTAQQDPPETAQSEPGSETEPGSENEATPANERSLRVFESRTGDLDVLIEHRLIRALVPWSDTYYYLDGAQQRGISFEAISMFETWLNEDLASDEIEVHVVVLPVRRDLLIPYIAEGRGDVALGGITITDERKTLVDFSEAASKPIEEWLIESADAPRVENKDDLSGRTVYVRKSSSYWESLETLNADFESRGLAPVKLHAVDEYLSTEDLLQLANAGSIPYTVSDHEIAKYWSEIFPDIRIRDDIVLRSDARIAWAIRKDSPQLKQKINQFLDGHKAGTLLGNVVFNRYLRDTSRMHSIHGDEEQERFNNLYDHFDEYAAEYGFDALIMVAQGFQESQLDQSRRSNRGAVGVMQLLPSTAASPEVGIEDISTADNNILAGIRYMDWIRKTYFDDPELDEFNRTALAFASYNAGPNRIRGLRRKTAERGLDPNVWFENVEILAAEEIGSETVDYVANIYKYYMAYRLSEMRSESD